MHFSLSLMLLFLVVRDQDGHIYFRENDGCLMLGGFEPVAKPAFEDGHLPDSNEARQLPEDWDHFHVLLEEMLHRIPILGSTTLDRLVNGPEAFSPDCKWILGEAPEVRIAKSQRLRTWTKLKILFIARSRRKICFFF